MMRGDEPISAVIDEHMPHLAEHKAQRSGLLRFTQDRARRANQSCGSHVRP